VSRPRATSIEKGSIVRHHYDQSTHTTDNSPKANLRLVKRPRPPDIRVPGWLARRREISPGAKLYYAALKYHARKKNRAWPGAKRLIDWLGLSSRSISRYQSELRKYGLIRIQRRFMGSTICFFVENHRWAMRQNGALLSTPKWRTEFFLTKKQQNNAAAATLFWHHKTFGTSQ